MEEAFKEELHDLILKYKFKRHIFIGCTGPPEDEHPISFFEDKKSLVKMLDQIQEAIEQYFALAH